MKLRINKQYKLRDYVEEKDPFGQTWTWKIRYYGNKDHTAFLRKAGGGEALAPFTALTEQCMMAAAAEAQQKKLKGKPSQEFMRIRAAEIYADKVFDVDISLLERVTASPKGLARHVVLDVEGVKDEDGNPHDYSPDIGEEIFEEIGPLPFEYEIEESAPEVGDGFYVAEGTRLGVAYRRWVLWVSQRVDKYREVELELAGKASADS